VVGVECAFRSDVFNFYPASDPPKSIRLTSKQLRHLFLATAPRLA
jgi:hypothetical protein